jgi:hypothetical protein
MDEPIEQRYEDVLQNIEFAIVQVDHSATDLTDWEVGDALDALIQTYNAEANGRSAPVLRLTSLKRQVYERIRDMCEWRPGRKPILAQAEEEATQEPMPEPEPKTLDEIIACLKRIRLSVKRWHGGGDGAAIWISSVSSFGKRSKRGKGRRYGA